MRSIINAPEPVLVAHIFPEIHHAMLDLLRDLSPLDWQRLTACAGWSVKDIALHILGGEIGNLSRRRDEHRTAAQVEGWDSLVEFVNTWNEEWVKAGRRLSAPVLIELWELTGRQMYEYFQSLDPFEIGGSVGWAGA